MGCIVRESHLCGLPSECIRRRLSDLPLTRSSLALIPDASALLGCVLGIYVGNVQHRH